MNPLYYNSNTERAYTADEVLALFGINTATTDIEVLNYYGFYPVNQTTPTADANLYINTPEYTVNGQYADQTWVVTPRPLPQAAANAETEIRNAADAEVASILATAGITGDVLSGVLAQPVNRRPVEYTDTINAVTNISNMLATQIAAIAVAVDVDELNDIVNAWNNPTTYYATINGAVYNDLVYNVGDSLVVYSANPLPPIPAEFTLDEPLGSLSAYDTWQWDGDSWIASPFPISYNLVQAQAYLTTLVETNSAERVNNQLRNYNQVDIATAADPTLLAPADIEFNDYQTIADYITAVDASTATQFSDIAAATAVNELYSFDPTVPEPPNYTP